MTTKLDGQLRREIEIDGEPYVVTLGVDGLKLVPKGRRKGLELAWSALVSGEAALATALNASLGMSEPSMPAQARRSEAPRSQRGSVSNDAARPHGRGDGDAAASRAATLSRRARERSASKP